MNTAQIIEDAFCDTWDATETPDVYAIKVIFARKDGTDVRACLAPYLCFSEEKAQRREHEFMGDHRQVAMFTTWFNLVQLKLDEPIWYPLVSRVVKLAPVPF